MSVALARRDAGLVIAGIVIVAIAAVILHLIGHPWFCKCGYVRLWWGETVSAENSQQITDWYTPTHIVHGLIFYFLLWLVARRLPLGLRAFIALLVEAGWEVLENTPLIIDRYREQTVSLGYFGDSVINSMSDIVAMLVGFYLAEPSAGLGERRAGARHRDRACARHPRQPPPQRSDAHLSGPGGPGVAGRRIDRSCQCGGFVRKLRLRGQPAAVASDQRPRSGMSSDLAAPRMSLSREASGTLRRRASST